jgi:hypothetical protein
MVPFLITRSKGVAASIRDGTDKAIPAEMMAEFLMNCLRESFSLMQIFYRRKEAPSRNGKAFAACVDDHTHCSERYSGKGALLRANALQADGPLQSIFQTQEIIFPTQIYGLSPSGALNTENALPLLLCCRCKKKVGAGKRPKSLSAYKRPNKNKTITMTSISPSSPLGK